jgi:hypothetical protein
MINDKQIWFFKYKLLLNYIYDELIKWINSEKLNINVPNKDFYNYLLNMLYHECYLKKCIEKKGDYVNQDDIEIFELKYTSDLTDLFIIFRKKSNNLCLNLFDNSSSDNLINFLSGFVDINESSSDLEEDQNNFSSNNDYWW